MNQYVVEPTRRDNILDVFCTNNPHLVQEVRIKDTFLSDHKIIELLLALRFEEPQVTANDNLSSFKALDFTRADFHKISEVGLLAVFFELVFFGFFCFFLVFFEGLVKKNVFFGFFCFFFIPQKII